MVYVIQTTTGQEEELLLFFDRIISKELYKSCFIPKGEWLKRLGGSWQLKVNPLFPGYVFVETERAEELFLELKAVPKLTKLLGGGAYDFTPLEADEEDFLNTAMGDDGGHIVRLSTVTLEDDGTLVVLEGRLDKFVQNIVKINLRKRFVLVDVRMMGQMKTVLFGVRLEKDGPRGC